METKPSDNSDSNKQEIWPTQNTLYSFVRLLSLPTYRAGTRELQPKKAASAARARAGSKLHRDRARRMAYFAECAHVSSCGSLATHLFWGCFNFWLTDRATTQPHPGVPAVPPSWLTNPALELRIIHLAIFNSRYSLHLSWTLQSFLFVCPTDRTKRSSRGDQGKTCTSAALRHLDWHNVIVREVSIPSC